MSELAKQLIPSPDNGGLRLDNYLRMVGHRGDITFMDICSIKDAGTRTHLIDKYISALMNHDLVKRI